MSIFGGHRKEKDQDIIIIENLIINPEHDHHHHPHHKKIHTYISKLIFSNGTQITGKIMATVFKKAEKVQYVIAFKDINGADAPVTGFSISATNGNVTVVPDTTNPLTGEILGAADGDVTINWSGNSAGGVNIPGTADITIADEAPPIEAVSTTITFSAPIPQ